MNASAAATQANVTVATIRAWCRRGVVSAIKQAGRWIVDTSSLAARIAIGAMRARKKGLMADTVDLTATYTWTPAGASGSHPHPGGEHPGQARRHLHHRPQPRAAARRPDQRHPATR
ncbi:hypothetical protein [Streptomyces sp. NPDC058671]|uniref:hypothetical protein n=1 Tax=Streptomyces sp. NPDC058671 TaxID=3346590 RepID=UPI0036670A20